MPVPFELFRGVLLALAVCFGFELGRSIIRVRKGLQRQAKAYGWFFRLLLCFLGLLWRHSPGVIDYLGYLVIAAAVAGGLYLQSRPAKEPGNISKEMFPEP